MADMRGASIPLRILLVEDDEEDRLVFLRTLRKSDLLCEITECERAEEALERLHGDASSFDLVVVDHLLPGMSGLDLCRELLDRALPLPLVILTGRGSEAFAVEALKAGVDDYIVKDAGGSYLELLPAVLLDAVRRHADRLACQRAEEALREREDLYRSFLQDFHGIVFRHVQNSGFVFFYGAVEEMTGYTADEFTTGKVGWDTLVHPDDAGSAHELAKKVRSVPGCVGEQEYRIIHKDGQIRWVHDLLKNIGDDPGKPTQLQGAIYDITGRKRAEEALRESEQALRSLINATTESAFLMATDGTVLAVNETMAQRLGSTVAALVGKRGYGFLPHDVAQARTPHAEDVIRTGKPVRFEDSRFGRHIYNSIYPVFDTNGKVTRLAIFGYDVTDLKEAEGALRESEERFRALTESTSDWIWELDENAVYTYASPKVKDLLGYEPDEIIGKTPFDLMPPEEAKRVAAEFDAILEARKPFDRLENANLHKDGRRVVLETSGVPFFDANGNLRGYHGIDRDITERKQAESIRQMRQEELEALQAVSLQITRESDRQRAVAGIPDIIRDLMQADACCLFLLADGGRKFDVLCDQHVPKSVAKELQERTTPETGWTGWVCRTGKKAIIRDLRKSRRWKASGLPASLDRGYNAFVSVPLRGRESTLGVLEVAYYRPPELDPNRVNFLVSLGRNVGVMVEHALLDARLQEADQRLRAASVTAREKAEEERMRVAGLLHDDVAQALSLARMEVDLMAAKPPKPGSDTRERLARVSATLHDALQTVRELSRRLMPSRLDLGLATALTRMVEHLRANTAPRLSLKISHREHLAPEVEHALFYVAQEAIRNAIRHADTKTIKVELKHAGRKAVLSVADDGRGFDAAQAGFAPGGLGLQIMKERIRTVGGDLGIISAPETGTVIRASVTLKKGAGQ